jgi:hypothetical protein
LRWDYARFLYVLGCLEAASGNLDRGLGACRKAHEQLEQALRETPEQRSLQSDWLSSREALARCRFLEGDLTRARWIVEQQAIFEERKQLVGHEQPSPRFSGELAGSAAVLAGLLLEAGRPAAALACVEEVLPAQEKVVRAEQERVQAAVKEQQEVEQFPDQPDNLHYLRLFLRKTPIVADNALHRQWALLLARRGAALAGVGRGEEAAGAVRQAVALSASILWRDHPLVPSASFWTSLPALLRPMESCHLYDLACHLALASTLPGANGKSDLAEQAVRTLRCSVAAGFANLHQFRTDPALDPLRKRADFQKLVRDLEAKSHGGKDTPQNP